MGQIVFGPDGRMHLSVGTVTNSAVVGVDDAIFGWLRDSALRTMRDIPCQDVVVTDKSTFSLQVAGIIILAAIALIALIRLPAVFAGRSWLHVWRMGERPVHFWPRLGKGFVAGIIGGMVMGVVSILAAIALPWFVVPRLLASIVMGRQPLVDALTFEPVSTVTGLLVLLLLTGIFGLIFSLLAWTNRASGLIVSGVLWGLFVWSLFQFVLGPLLFPLVIDKGFEPPLYALAFAIYGLVLGLVFAFTPKWHWTHLALPHHHHTTTSPPP